MKKKFKLNSEIAKTTGDGWFGPTVGPDSLALFLGELKSTDRAVIEINSPGGDVIAGLEMANAIKNCKAEITAHIVGVAASMASVIACACDKIRMEEASFLMVHNPWTVSMGDADQLRHEADVLDNMRSAMMCFYKSKFPTLTEETIAEMCDDETWLTASQAVEAGLEAEIIPCTMRAAAAITQMDFAKIPDGAKAFLVRATPEDPTPPSAEETAEETPAEETAEETAEATPEEVTPPAEETPAEETTVEPPAEETAEEQASWKSRYQGASKKINALMAQAAEMESFYKSEIKQITDTFNARIADLEHDLDEVNTRMSSMEEERDKALEDLAQAREQASKALDAHAALAGGVLTPPARVARSVAEIGTDPSLSPAERSRMIAQGEYI